MQQLLSERQHALNTSGGHSSVIEDRGCTTYNSMFHGERAKSPELGTRSAWHPFQPWTLKENVVYIIQPNPIPTTTLPGLQLGAAVMSQAQWWGVPAQLPLQVSSVWPLRVRSFPGRFNPLVMMVLRELPWQVPWRREPRARFCALRDMACQARSAWFLTPPGQ